MNHYIQPETLPEDNKNLGWLYQEILSWCNGDVLDYGCNNCNLNGYFCINVNSYTGVDLPEVIRKFKLKDAITPMQFLLSKKKYDTIVLANVIEHIENHTSLINSLIKRLNKGGRMIIVVPNLQSTKKAIASLIGRKLGADKYHIHGFTTAEINNLANLNSMACYNYYAPTLKKEFIISIWNKRR